MPKEKIFSLDHKLTAKQDKWIDEYIKTNDLKTATINAGYKSKYPESQGRENYKKLQYIIEARFNNINENVKAKSDVVYSVQELQEFWTCIIKDNQLPIKDRLRSSELLGKSLNAFVTQIENNDIDTKWFKKEDVVENDKIVSSANYLIKDNFNEWIYNIINDYSNRVEVYYGGAGSGKSYGGTQKVILKALQFKRKVLIIRKIQRTIKDSIYNLIVEHLKSMGYYSKCDINKSDLSIVLPNGSMFLFKGLDDPEKIKSINDVTDIVIEEATELTENDYTQLNLRLRAKVDNLQIYLFFNPISKKNWVYDYFFVNKPSNVSIFKTTYKDNKFLSDEYRNELENLRERNPAYYNIYCLGKFATLDKLVFPVFEKRIISNDEVKGLYKFTGLDFGYVNDPSALVWGYIDSKEKIIYITGEYVKKGMMNDEISQTIIDLGLKKDKIFADCAEPKSIQEIKNKGINIAACQKGKDSIVHGIQWILQNKIVIDERCFKTIEEFENYTWKKDKKTNEYINEPVDTYNHTIDALRYALNKFIKGTPNLKVCSKPKGL